MKIRVTVLILIALIFNSCNKKSLPPKDDEPAAPVFYFTGDLGGFPIDIKAGVNAYYMKSSYYLDSNSVYAFKGELKQKNCSDCGFGLTVLINDYKISAANATMHIDSTLMVNSYQYNDGNIEPVFYTGYFVPNPISQSSAYNWAFSDGTLWNSANCTKTLKANTTYTASLSSTGLAFSPVIHSNVYKVGNPVQANVNIIRINPLSVFNYKFSAANITGQAPFTYSWDFGDGYGSPEPTPSHEYLVSGFYTATLTLVDANSDTCISYYQVPAFNGTFGQSNFTANFTAIQNTKALSAITILVNDPKGVVYSSASANQDSKTNFQVISIDDYKATDNSGPFKKIKIKFNCTVYNGANSLEIKNGEAVIAVMYKN